MHLRKIRWAYIIVILPLVLTFMTCSKGNEELSSGITRKAKITGITGDVKVIIKGKLTKAKPGMILYEGDKIITGNGWADLKIAGLGVLKVKPNSEVSLSSIGKENKFKVKKGKFLLALEKLKKGQTLKVYTSTAVAGVRGTSFLVAVEEDRTKIAVLTGVVNVKSGKGEKDVPELKEVIVSEEEMTAIKPMEVDTIRDVKDIGTINGIETLSEYDKIKSNLKKLVIAEASVTMEEPDIEALKEGVEAGNITEEESKATGKIRESKIKTKGELPEGGKKFIEDKEF